MTKTKGTMTAITKERLAIVILGALFVVAGWFQDHSLITVASVAGCFALLFLGARFNPFVPGRISNERIRGVLLLIGATATLIVLVNDIIKWTRR